MPVDIRSFFQKKPPANASKKSSNNNNHSSSSNDKAKKPVGTTKPAKAAASTTNTAAKKPSENKKATRKRQIAPDNDVVVVDDEKDDENEAAVVDNRKSKVSKKPPTAAKHNDASASKKDSSSSNASSKASSPSKRKRLVIESDDDNDKGDDDYQDDEVEIVDDTKTSRTTAPARRSSPRKSKQPAAKPVEKVAMSPSQYFGKKTKNEEEELPSPAKKMKASPPPTKKKAAPASSTKKESAKKKEDYPLAPENVAPLQSLSLSQAAPECLAGYTFCITAFDPEWSREDATDFLKGLGARVTTAVSGKTHYLLVLGEVLEDERNYTEGSKYKKAMELGTRVIVGRPSLNGVVQFHSIRKGGAPVADVVAKKESPKKTKTEPMAASSAKAPPAAAVASAVKNPYARKINNPYARKTTAAAAAESKPDKSRVADKKPAASKSTSEVGDSGSPMLWVDKYKPKTSNEILGNQDSVRKLRNWLTTWESLFNKDSVVGKAFSNPKGPWKAVLLSGPPGIGKTTTATLISQESGRHVLEYNASDVRSKSSLKEGVGDITGSRTLRFGTKGEPTKRVIIMDEVDGLGAGDRGGLSEMIQMIKNSRVPIICICNDRQSQKIKSLVPYCMDLKYKRPVKTQIATRAVEVARREGLTVEQNAAELLAESCGNDVRQVLNSMQMWASEKKGDNRMSYTNLKEREKSINKDEMLRVSLFDATRLIVQGRVGLQGASPEAERANFFKRNDAFFVDYNFTGLMVQQNYLNVMKGAYSRAAVAGKTTEVEDILERMSKASESMSDFALSEHKLRSDQNWSVLPLVGSLAVKTGFHAGGEYGGILGGFPEFTTWLGKNSSKGKKERMMQDLQHHMNFKISGGSEEMRLSYLPVLRGRFLSLLQRKDGSGNEEAIDLMDTYGLDRDDILEKFDEFKMDSKDKGFSVLDSKQKTALTKAYNQGAHKSQALVWEQGGAKKGKRKAGAVEEIGDPDAIDDDKVEEEEEEELDSKAVADLFKKKGRKAAPKKAGATKKPAPKRKKN